MERGVLIVLASSVEEETLIRRALAETGIERHGTCYICCARCGSDATYQQVLVNSQAVPVGFSSSVALQIGDVTKLAAASNLHAGERWYFICFSQQSVLESTSVRGLLTQVC